MVVQSPLNWLSCVVVFEEEYNVGFKVFRLSSILKSGTALKV